MRFLIRLCMTIVLLNTVCFAQETTKTVELKLTDGRVLRSTGAIVNSHHCFLKMGGAQVKFPIEQVDMITFDCSSLLEQIAKGKKDNEDLVIEKDALLSQISSLQAELKKAKDERRYYKERSNEERQIADDAQREMSESRTKKLEKKVGLQEREIKRLQAQIRSMAERQFSQGSSHVVSRPQSQSTARSTKLSPPNDGKNWREVASFSGTGIKKTPPFKVETDFWCIRYRVKVTNEFGGMFMMMLKSLSGGFPDIIGNTTESTDDVSYQYKSGEYFLDMNTANVRYVVTVFEVVK